MKFFPISEILPNHKLLESQEAYLFFSVPSKVTKVILDVFLELVLFLSPANTEQTSKLSLFLTYPTVFENTLSDINFINPQKIVTEADTLLRDPYYKNRFSNEINSLYRNVLAGLLKQPFLGNSLTNKEQTFNTTVSSTVFFENNLFFFSPSS